MEYFEGQGGLRWASGQLLTWVLGLLGLSQLEHNMLVSPRKVVAQQVLKFAELKVAVPREGMVVAMGDWLNTAIQLKDMSKIINIKNN